MAFQTERAQASKLPEHSADGYGWGGGAVLTIGTVSFLIGEGRDAHALAAEIARRWNAARPTTQPGGHDGE